MQMVALNQCSRWASIDFDDVTWLHHHDWDSAPFDIISDPISFWFGKKMQMVALNQVKCLVDRESV